MAITIKDVAKRAGVAPSTVSRVISDNKAISDTTKIRVRKAMKELNYRPNVNARNLVHQTANAVGIVFPSEDSDFYQNPFFIAMLREINVEAVNEGYSIILSIGETLEQRYQQVQQLVLEQRVDGLLFLYANSEDPIIQFAYEEKIPFTIIGYMDHPDINFVDNDNFRAGQMVAEALILKGYKQLYLLGGNAVLSHITHREAGIRQEAEKHNILLTVNNSAGTTIEDGYKIYPKLKQMRPDTAVIITEQTFADGVIMASQSDNGHLPIITFRTTGQFPLAFLATDDYIDLNTSELGREAMKNLLTQLKNPDAPCQQSYIDVKWRHA
ncbi:LacI family DNA-binding transcriptional regulator [Aerococcaceae bacterium DSM 111020]|nr:LacI family DNA-binding transcriptional regulator [Aerococcaceae bacterium DSM 111020]